MERSKQYGQRFSLEIPLKPFPMKIIVHIFRKQESEYDMLWLAFIFLTKEVDSRDCYAYDRCLTHLPNVDIYTRSEVAEAWKETYTCLSNVVCQDYNFGAGRILGRCLSLHR